MRESAARRAHRKHVQQAFDALQDPNQQLFDRAHRLLHRSPARPGMLELVGFDSRQVPIFYRDLASTSHEINGRAYRLTSRLRHGSESLYIRDFVAVERLEEGHPAETMIEGTEYAIADAGNPIWQVRSFTDQTEDARDMIKVRVPVIASLHESNWVTDLGPRPAEEDAPANNGGPGVQDINLPYLAPALKEPLFPRQLPYAQFVIDSLLTRIETQAQE